MDPGNWATDLAAGSSSGYALLWVVALSSAMAMLLQSLCCRLGIATGLDLAQACRQFLPPAFHLPLWLLAELAIVACDLAELVGSAIALQLLFGLPLAWGVTLTAADTLLLLGLQQQGLRRLEALVIALVALIGACFVVELVLLKPDWLAVAHGFVPHPLSMGNQQQLLLAAGILGATVMPHNLYLHSSLVQSRQWPDHPQARHWALRLATADMAIALAMAFLVNAAILVLAGGAFHGRGLVTVTDLGQAYHLLTPLLGTSLAGLAFGIALLASGQSSTITGTLAGQVVMEGFLGAHVRLKPWARRLLTRSVALIPAIVVASSTGDAGVATLLNASQVALSIQLPFAIFPLVQFTSSSAIMGDMCNGRVLSGLAWLIFLAVTVINAKLVVDFCRGA
jgi:manganese transport protein